ncbi:hypothetical protein [Rhodococcoides yunnanense]|uniref:hypothetical protein n=1 Tax=Rhodococcoides yunnanense TaxID=278209 RepID=UPI0022B12684|nr:hypothetical protein [Rhodococcus yunnanensis]MCZ4278502.1 hypothetical protein [Rhodococcus yunnanensis]
MTSSLFVQSSPISSDVEDEFDRWYDTVHIPQVVARVAGVIRGTRYVENPTSSEASATETVRRRLTIYELDNDDVVTTMDSLLAAMKDGSLEASPLIDREVNPPQISAWQAG